MQDVIDELTTSMRGHELYFTSITTGSSLRFHDVFNRCREQGHLAMGFQRGKELTLNADAELMVQDGDRIITMGATRLKALAF